MNKDKLLHISNFIEEIHWIIESSSNKMNLKEMSSFLKKALQEQEKRVQTNRITNDEKKLVGVLPRLLQNNDVFKSTKELLDFAEEVLGLNPKRAAKRSKIEYIGWIVCEVSNLDNNKLKSLYNLLYEFIEDEKNIDKVKKEKNHPNFSWNETIQKLGVNG